MMKYLKLIAKPIEDNLPYSLIFLLLITLPEIYSSIHGEYITANRFNFACINVFATCVVTCYIFSLILQLLPNYLKSWYRIVTLLLVCLHFIINVFLLLSYGHAIDYDIVAIIGGSNEDEIKEYLSMYISPLYLICFVLIIVGVYGIFRVLKNKTIPSGKYSVIISIFLIGCLFSIIRRSVYFKLLFPGIYISLFFPSAEDRIDLSEHLTNLDIEHVNTQQPQNVVLIIGESFSKSHSSLYGYNKNTNPLLTKCKMDSLLWVYTDVTSPATSTIPCFKQIMSTYREGDTIPWYKQTTIIEVMNKVGYSTYWISNQSKKGIDDNIPSKFSDICKNNFFVGNKYGGSRSNSVSYDEEVIELAIPLMEDSKDNKFFCFHLMGSHPDFKKRYPESFKQFISDDYADKLNSQHNFLAEYDNSILYNDYVVHEIMNLFHDKEAIVFYFSDHGFDVYESSSNHIGHAIKTNPNSVEIGKKIPFMIYTSPKYQKNYPEKVEMIKKTLNKSYNTRDLIYTIMDVVGIKFKDGSENMKSLLVC